MESLLTLGLRTWDRKERDMIAKLEGNAKEVELYAKVLINYATENHLAISVSRAMRIPTLGKPWYWKFVTIKTKGDSNEGNK